MKGKAERDAFVADVRKIDGNLADAIEEAFRAGYSLEQVKDLCRGGIVLTEGPQ